MPNIDLFNKHRAQVRYVVLFLALWVGYLVPSCFVVNISPSTEYRIFLKSFHAQSSAYKPGDYVLFHEHLPEIDAGKDVTVTKVVECTSGQHLQSNNSRDFYCDGRYLGRAKLTSLKGEPLGYFSFDGPIPNGKIFVMGQHKDSYDSRYFGLVDTINVTTKLIPIL